MQKTNKLNETLKAKERLENQNGNPDQLRLDDVSRVKILSPSALIAKRFLRNRLAVVGSCILIFILSP